MLLRCIGLANLQIHRWLFREQTPPPHLLGRLPSILDSVPHRREQLLHVPASARWSKASRLKIKHRPLHLKKNRPVMLCTLRHISDRMLHMQNRSLHITSPILDMRRLMLRGQHSSGDKRHAQGNIQHPHPRHSLARNFL